MTTTTYQLGANGLGDQLATGVATGSFTMDSRLFSMNLSTDPVVSSPNLSSYLTNLAITQPAFSYSISGSTYQVPAHTYTYNDGNANTSDASVTLTGDASGGYFLNLSEGNYRFKLAWTTDNADFNNSTPAFDTTPTLDTANSYAGYRSSGTTYRDNFQSGDVLVCYAKGTHLTTDRGPVAVEDLQVNDLVLTVSGKYEPVTWIGHRRVNCLRHDNPTVAWPVRIAKDAFGPDMPIRDLLVSPAHAIYVDGHFIAAASLVNGVTISQEPWSKVTYYHVELPTHNAVYAEGLAAETYLDADNRDFFLETEAVVELDAQFSEATPQEVYASKGYAPLASSGPVLESVRTKLLNRITELGHQLQDDPKLELIVDGASLEVLRTPVGLVAWIPEGAKTMTLRSNSFVPGYVYATSFDDRHLGVSVTSMRLGNKAIDLQSSALLSGWHDAETTYETNQAEQSAFTWRWTDGEATIALEQSGCLFEVTTQAAAKVYWQAKDGQYVQVKKPGEQELRYAA